MYRHGLEVAPHDVHFEPDPSALRAGATKALTRVALVRFRSEDDASSLLRSTSRPMFGGCSPVRLSPAPPASPLAGW
jgi:hypothetical protein